MRAGTTVFETNGVACEQRMTAAGERPRFVRRDDATAHGCSAAPALHANGGRLRDAITSGRTTEVWRLETH
jgi:hypothetical protein